MPPLDPWPDWQICPVCGADEEPLGEVCSTACLHCNRSWPAKSVDDRISETFYAIRVVAGFPCKDDAASHLDRRLKVLNRIREIRR